MTSWEFPCSEPATLTVSSWPSGSVAVSGEDTDTITVEVVASHPGRNVDDALAEVRATFEDGKLRVTGPRISGMRRNRSLELTIKVPAGSDCEVRTASADITCVGQLAAVALQTASGDVTCVGASGNVTVQAVSGDVFVDKAGADVAVRSASGDVRVTDAHGEVRADTVSGDLAVARCGSPLIAHTVSGDLEVRELAGGRADLSTVSGDVTASVLPGLSVYLDLSSTSGHVRSDLEEDSADETGATPDASLEIKCRTISGDVRITKPRAGASSRQTSTA